MGPAEMGRRAVEHPGVPACRSARAFAALLPHGHFELDQLKQPGAKGDLIVGGDDCHSEFTKRKAGARQDRKAHPRSSRNA